MNNLQSWKVIMILLELTLGISASTHWIVTENGRIQSQLDSVFHMQRPYDLLALLEQESRIQDIENLQNELTERKRSIDKQSANLEGAADLESRLYSQDPDCVKAGHTLLEADLYVSVIGDVKGRIDLDSYLMSGKNGLPKLPDCIGAVDLEFSMPSFEHLQVMTRRANLSTDPELSLASYVLEDQDMTQFAHQIAFGLTMNSTSWLHHNLAAVYWRIQGNAPNAVECARRAIHFAPREYRDLALLTLGGLLQQAEALVEAALVLHAAVDHAPFAPQNHLALGIVYAILGDGNRSVACLDNALKLHPNLQMASKLRHAVMCHHKLEQGLLSLHQSLQSMLMELQEYHAHQECWLQLQERLLREQAPLELRFLDQDPSIVSHVQGQNCIHSKYGGIYASLSCDKSALGAFPWQIHSLQLLLRTVELRAKVIGEQMMRHSSTAIDHTMLESLKDVSKQLINHHPDTPGSAMLLEKKQMLQQRQLPSEEECSRFTNQFLSIWDVSSLYLSPEEKGFEAHLYLGRLIGLGPGEEHALPWYPPMCSTKDVAHDPLVQRLFPAFLGEEVRSAVESQLQAHLLKYGMEEQPVEAEIGQRILSAMNKDVGPQWLLHSLAALYWRVRGNSRYALDCLQVAVAAAPPHLRDLPLISLGSLLLRRGLLQAAKHAAQEALEVNNSQVIAHFLLSLVLEAQNNHSGAAHHLQFVVNIEPNYMDGKAMQLLQVVLCHDQYGQMQQNEKSSQEMCGTAKSMDLLTRLEEMKEGDTVVCSADGQQCNTMQCFSGAGSSQSTQDDPLEQMDETELERMLDPNAVPKQFHVQIALGDGGEAIQSPYGEFYVPVALMDNTWLRVYDKSGTYALSPAECERIYNVDWIQETVSWISSAGGILLDDLPPLPNKEFIEMQEPVCDHSLPSSHLTLDYLSGVRLRYRLETTAETGLVRWLAVILSDHTSNTQELGTRLAIALEENTTSWVLATAAAVYWRIVGKADQAVTCLRQALQYAPNPVRKFPLLSLANVLYRLQDYTKQKKHNEHLYSLAHATKALLKIRDLVTLSINHGLVCTVMLLLQLKWLLNLISSFLWLTSQ